MLNKTAIFGLLFVLGAEGYAAANIAKIPVGIRQLYDDGTATELVCTARSVKLNECVFRIMNSREEVSLSIQGNYMRSSPFPDYSYWSTSRTELTIAVDIQCPVQELRRLKTEDREEAECRVFLMASDGELVQRNIEVWVAGVPWRDPGK